MNKDSFWKLEVQLVPDSWMGLNNRGSFLYDCIETFMGFCLTYPILAMVLYFATKNIGIIYKWMLLSFILLVMACFRNFIKRDIIHHLLYIIVFGIVYLLCFSLWEKIFVMFYTFIVAIMSFRKRKRNQVTYYTQNMLFLGCSFLFLEFIISVLLKIKPVQIVVIYSTITFCLFCMIYYNITRTKKLLEWEQQTSKEDMKRINTSSRRFVGVITSVVAVFTFMFGMAGAFRGSNFVFKDSWLFKLLAFLLKFLFPDTGGEKAPPPQETVQQQGNMPMPQGADGPGFLAVIMKVLEFIIFVIVGLIILIIIFLIFREIYRKLMNIIHGNKNMDDKMEETSLDLEGMIENIKGRFDSIRTGIHFSFDRSNNGRIRKIYYRIVMKNKKDNTVIRRSYTPRNIRKVIIEDSKRDITGITEIYERARYGNGECTKEDLMNIKGYK